MPSEKEYFFTFLMQTSKKLIKIYKYNLFSAKFKIQIKQSRSEPKNFHSNNLSVHSAAKNPKKPAEKRALTQVLGLLGVFLRHGMLNLPEYC